MNLRQLMNKLIQKSNDLAKIREHFIFHTDGMYKNEDREVNDFDCVWDFIDAVKGLQGLVYDIDDELRRKRSNGEDLEDYTNIIN